MPAVILSGGRTRRKSSSRVRIPKLPARSRRRRAPVTIPQPASATASERAALQSLAQRLQRGNFSAWKNAAVGNGPSPAATEAARAAALTGAPATATDLVTGTTATAMPLGGSGRRRTSRRKSSATRSRMRSKALKGGFLPALIPIIAAAIGAIPGIAGTAVGIASLQEQKRQFNRMYGKTNN
ncbi:pX [Pigeon adenovirus 2a]|uniref:Core protein pX n=1 Tax=Pigeon adenovirus 2 TaxID=1907767 RepID=A0A1D8QMB0_9ADEN|nr:core protein precursor pX [Pigeon adenovirus 2]AOW42081.1 core protein precursor pX [Pigeon adenovirus 2]APO40950.1 pX [Pigeon adenovirus 2a]